MKSYSPFAEGQSYKRILKSFKKTGETPFPSGITNYWYILTFFDQPMDSTVSMGRQQPIDNAWINLEISFTVKGQDAVKGIAKVSITDVSVPSTPAQGFAPQYPNMNQNNGVAPQPYNQHQQWPQNNVPMNVQGQQQYQHNPQGYINPQQQGMYPNVQFSEPIPAPSYPQSQHQLTIDNMPAPIEQPAKKTKPSMNQDAWKYSADSTGNQIGVRVQMGYAANFVTALIKEGIEPTDENVNKYLIQMLRISEILIDKEKKLLSNPPVDALENFWNAIPLFPEAEKLNDGIPMEGHARVETPLKDKKQSKKLTMKLTPAEPEIQQDNDPMNWPDEQ